MQSVNFGVTHGNFIFHADPHRTEILLLALLSIHMYVYMHGTPQDQHFGYFF